MIENLELILIIKPSFIALKMTNRGLLSKISLTGRDGFDWSISQNVLVVNDWLTSHKYLTLVGIANGLMMQPVTFEEAN